MTKFKKQKPTTFSLKLSGPECGRLEAQGPMSDDTAFALWMTSAWGDRPVDNDSSPIHRAVRSFVVQLAAHRKAEETKT